MKLQMERAIGATRPIDVQAEIRRWYNGLIFFRDDVVGDPSEQVVLCIIRGAGGGWPAHSDRGCMARLTREAMARLMVPG